MRNHRIVLPFSTTAPAQRSTDGRYWSSTDCDDDIYDYAFHLEIGSEGEHSVYRFFRNEEYAVRPIQN